MKGYAAAADTLAGKTERDPKSAKLHEVHVRRAHGGYIARHAEHRHKDGAVAHSHPDQGSEHVLPDMAALQAHLAEHMQDEPAGADTDAAADAATKE